MAGPLIIEVTTAMMTRATNRRWRTIPASRAIRPRTISMAPREFMAKPTAQASRGAIRAPAGSEDAAGEFADACDRQNNEHQAAVEMGKKVHLQSDAREEHRSEDERYEMVDDRASALAKVGRVPHGNPDEKGAEDRVNPDPLGEGAAENGEDYGEAQFATRPVSVRLHVGQDPVNDPTA